MICDICKKEAERVAQELLEPGLREQFIDVARRDWQQDDLEIDDNAEVGTNDEGDAWVQAWVFVRRSEL